MYEHEYGDATSYASRPPRRFRHPAVVAGAAALTLVLVPVAADRFAAARVESNTAQAFQEGMDTPQRPEVHVRGFPVLTQMASGSLRQVDITAHDIPADGSARPLPVSRLDLRLNGLTRSADDTEARARSARATASLTYADVSDALGPEVSQGAGRDQVAARIRLPFGDEATVTARVSVVSGNRIAFEDFQVTGGPLPDAGRKVLETVFDRPIQLENIPEGLTLRSVTTSADGLTARFSGTSVTFHPENQST
ncbi:DUF2993 domain-containing protein [Streptomyces sp. S3(2020)]|uniref:LmeA family phospholipid-binding protein n=1 Tax=Streptomyces sp. S3(2020) TaxID=2732044 RepID=UPI0014884E8E|nr:DUF2993 domain-containing protein [Streptomyces sp. S3(2020)]NNN34026.1 DUF2993 domain-containing protein [Streptomyces sp. S3(2020)]